MTDTPRYHVFLSYHEQDETAADLIAERLRSEHGIEPWLRAWSAIPGRLTQEEQEQGLAQSQAYAVLIGVAGVRQWQQLEVYAAISRRSEAEGGSFPVIPVFLPECPAEAQEAMPAMLRLFEPVRLTTLDDQPGLARLAAGVRGEPALSASITLPDEPAPYRGLLPFEAEHARFFFGRDDDVRRLVEKLGQQRFVAVVGASGSGKSSLVMAGLLPRLAQNALLDSARWKVLRMTPGSEPLRSLANQLATLVPPGVDRLQVGDALVERLGVRQDGLRSALAAYLAEDPRPLVLFVDQFEELFTQCQERQEGQERCRAQVEQFVANLTDAVQHGGGRIRVLITLRADFLDRCLALPELRVLLEDRQVLLGPMDQPDLREAITRPAQAVGASFEKGLASLILRDVGDEPGRLPLLEHALHELWLARRGPWLTLDAYEASGGVQGALNQRAQATYEALDEEQQWIARNIFLRLTALGEGVPDTRRRVGREELYPPSAPRDEVDRVLAVLSGPEARLVIADTESVMVSHETLIQNWDTLRKWLDRSREGIRIHRRLTEAAREWQQNSRNESYLYRGARLETAREWAKDHTNDLNQLERSFLDESIAVRNREKQAQQKRRRYMMAGLAGAAMLFMILAILAGIQWRRASQQEKIALARQLSAQARTHLAEFDLAALLSIEANNLLDSPETWGSLLAVLDSSPQISYFLHGQSGIVTDLAIDPNRRLLVSAGDSTRPTVWDLNTGQQQVLSSGDHKNRVLSIAVDPIEHILASGGDDSSIILWDLTTFQPLGSPLNGHEQWSWIHALAFSPDGKVLASGGSDKQVILWNVAEQSPYGSSLIGHQDEITDIEFSPDGGVLASADRDGTIRLWNPDDGRLLSVFETADRSWISGISFSPDGAKLAAARFDGTVVVLDVSTAKPIGDLRQGHDGLVLSVAFSPDGLRLASGGGDRRIVLWDLNSWQQEGTPLVGHTNGVDSLAFVSEDILVSGGADGRLVVWDLAVSDRLRRSLKEQIGWVHVAYGSNGEQLASGDSSGRILVYDTETWHPIPELDVTQPSSITALDFSQDGHFLATGGADGRARVWDVSDGMVENHVFVGHKGEISGVAFAPDTDRLATASTDGTVILWTLTGRLPYSTTLTGHTDQVLSVDFSPDGRLLASSGADSKVIIWNANTGEMINNSPLEGHTLWSWVTDVEFGADGRLLASSGGDGRIILWDAITGQRVGQPLVGHLNDVSAISFEPDGRTLVSAGKDGTVILWDTETGQPIGQPLVTNSNWVVSIDYSPQGTGWTTGSTDGKVLFWPILGAESAKREACAIANRNFTQDEWSHYLGHHRYTFTCPDN